MDIKVITEGIEMQRKIFYQDYDKCLSKIDQVDLQSLNKEIEPFGFSYMDDIEEQFTANNTIFARPKAPEPREDDQYPYLHHTGYLNQGDQHGANVVQQSMPPF